MQKYPMRAWRRLGVCLLSSALVFGTTATSAAATQQSSPIIPTPVPAPVPTSAATQQSSSFWAGGEIAPSSWASYVGGIHAFNGDLSADGFLVRGGFTFGEYDTTVPDGESDVSFQNANVLIGYQRAVGSGQIALYVGPDFTHNGSGASPDVRGSDWGVRGIAEVFVPIAPRLDLSGWATYSTIDSQYYVSLQTLYRAAPQFRIGPDAAVLGGDTWKQHRIGARAAFGAPIGEIGLGVGHVWDRRSASDGVYANAILSIRF